MSFTLPDFRKCLLCSMSLGALLLSGCHGDTGQGGGPDRGRAGTRTPPQPKPQILSTPGNPPSADQLDPNSPQAVINGTSTTSPGVTNRPAPAPPPRSN